MTSQQPLTIGIEEELFLVDKQTRCLVSAIPDSLLTYFANHYPGQIIQEFLVPQLEIVSRPHDNLVSLRQELMQLRQAICQACNDYGLAPIAASTHPFSHWSQCAPNPLARYQRLQEELQMPARRFLVAGMHIHVGGIDDNESRMQLLQSLSYYLPYLLTLSSSSPFWAGFDTGMTCYRLSVIDDLPRSGLPRPFTSYGEYQNYVDTLVKAGIINTATELWWDARISCRFPTVEMRIADVCTDLNDAMAVAAFYLCLVQRFQRQGYQAEVPTATRQALIHENRWRVQRHSLRECSLLSTQEESLMPVEILMSQLLEELTEDATVLGCQTELDYVNNILSRGTSSDQQRLVYDQAIDSGADPQQAMMAVVDDLMTTTSVLVPRK